jgi:lysophospholipase L1-like esterase
MSKPDLPPDSLNSTSPVKASAVVVAFLGSSSTAGKGQAFNWIAELERNPRNRRFRFYNFGVGGDLAYNALRRLPDLIACSPDKVVVWIGANDVLALVSPKVRRFFQISKRLPSAPSPAWFRENLATLAFCSLSPIGEDPASTNLFQGELNRRIAEYNAIIGEVARDADIGYIPVYEALLAEIRESPGRAFTGFRFLPFYRDAFRVLVERKSSDEIARLNGWSFHSDGIHLNRRGGMTDAGLVQAFLDR